MAVRTSETSATPTAQPPPEGGYLPMAAFHKGGLKDSLTKGLEWTSALQMGLFSERCPTNCRKLQGKDTPWT